MDEAFCDSCGKCMTSKTGATMARLGLSVKIPEDAPEDKVKFVELQYGKYFNCNGIEIHLCMECFIDSAFPNHNPYL